MKFPVCLRRSKARQKTTRGPRALDFPLLFQTPKAHTHTLPYVSSLHSSAHARTGIIVIPYATAFSRSRNYNFHARGRVGGRRRTKGGPGQKERERKTQEFSQISRLFVCSARISDHFSAPPPQNSKHLCIFLLLSLSPSQKWIMEIGSSRVLHAEKRERFCCLETRLRTRNRRITCNRKEARSIDCKKRSNAARVHIYLRIPVPGKCLACRKDDCAYCRLYFGNVPKTGSLFGTKYKTRRRRPGHA